MEEETRKNKEEEKEETFTLGKMVSILLEAQIVSHFDIALMQEHIREWIEEEED